MAWHCKPAIDSLALNSDLTQASVKDIKDRLVSAEAFLISTEYSKTSVWDFPVTTAHTAGRSLQWKIVTAVLKMLPEGEGNLFQAILKWIEIIWHWLISSRWKFKIGKRLTITANF